VTEPYWLSICSRTTSRSRSALSTQLGGQFVVDHDFAGACHFLDGHIEDGFLAGQMRCAVILWERHLDLLLVAGLGADKLLLEARNELAGAEHQIGIGVGAALESLAVDLADIVHRHAVAVSALPFLARRSRRTGRCA
jgi:hypothetical protein